VDVWIVGTVLFVGLFITVGMLRRWLSTLERTVIRLQGRVEVLERKSRAGSGAAVAAPSDPIDIEPFVD
jgi:hypothetical protein